MCPCVRHSTGFSFKWSPIPKFAILLKISGFKDMIFRCVNWSPSQLVSKLRAIWQGVPGSYGRQAPTFSESKQFCHVIPGTRVNQDHLLDRTEPDSTFALIIMQYEAIPYNTVKYNRANFSKDISSRSLSGNKLCSNTSSLSNSTWMTLPSWLQWNRFSRETKEKLILGFRAKRYLMHKVMLWGGFRWVFPIRFAIAGWRWK